jgi:leucyl-tRNA synthetase
MSKSVGNFMTLKEAVGTYSADATRIACAGAGDGLEDANFALDTASSAIKRLTTLKAWAEDMVSKLSSLREGELSFLDQIFRNEINSSASRAHEAYTRMFYADALKEVWFEMENLRSQYSMLTDGDIHKDVISQFLEVQMLTLSPIAPHFCEHMWRDVLCRKTLVVQERWPSLEPVDEVLARKYALIQGTLRYFRLELQKFTSPKKKKKGGSPPPQPTHAVIFVAKGYKKFQQEMLRLLQDVELDEENSPVDPGFMNQIKDAECLKSMPKAEAKQALGFAAFTMKTEVKARGRQALEMELPFDELAMLQDLLGVVKRQLGVPNIEIAAADQEHPRADAKRRAVAGPGKPLIVICAEQPEPAT